MCLTIVMASMGNWVDGVWAPGGMSCELWSSQHGHRPRLKQVCPDSAWRQYSGFRLPSLLDGTNLDYACGGSVRASSLGKHQSVAQDLLAST